MSDGLGNPEWWLSVPILGGMFGFMLRLRAISKKEVEKVRDDLEDFKVEVADRRASNSYVSEVENRLASLVKDVKDQTVRIENKLDRVIENHKK